MGSDNYWYSDYGSWKTTIPVKSQRIAYGQDEITSAVSECIAHEFQYRRYNTLAPTSLLISNPMTDYYKRICGDRDKTKRLADQGTPKVFGRFRAPGDPGIVKNWIDG